MSTGKIIRLDQHVADLIAAGEVVSRPASAVKELVENSIDAGAGIITIEIASGGMTYIRVTDNGCGVARDDLKTAFLRHATSKLYDASGLDAIETLGFRGEALAAIAAVSRIEILTRTAQSDEGCRLLLDAGCPSDISSAGCPPGTTIIVRDLFFNTPARLKFMKTDRAEGSAVSSVLLRAALSRPDISFKYIKDGKTQFHTPGDSKPESCIYSLLGGEFEAGFIPVSLSDEYLSVKGYASKPSAARGNRNYQFFFINGRVIRSALLQSALEQAYRNAHRSGQFPACVLYIATKANNVDVNVHPAKTEVRFHSDKQVFDGVYYAVSGALEQNGEKAAFLSAAQPGPVTEPVINTYSRAYSPAPAASPRPARGAVPQANNFDKPLFVSDASPEYRQKPQNLEFFDKMAAPEPFEVLGEAFGTYIIVERGDSLWFIDKHAAHERIHYDALASGGYVPMPQALISPVICRVGHFEAGLLLDNNDITQSLGFTIDSFGEDSVAVRYIPSDISQDDIESVLSEMCARLKQGSSPKGDGLDKIYKILACKAAIKAGSTSDIRELESLARRVMSKEITHCPHGRPVAYTLTKAVLEKNLGRI